MIHVKIFKDNNNNIVKYSICGHSGYAKTGSDIVCAAVSSVSQAAVLGLTRVLNIKVGLEVQESTKNPYLECILPQGMNSDLREKANVILETMLLTLKEFEEQYSEYIHILEQEV